MNHKIDVPKNMVGWVCSILASALVMCFAAGCASSGTFPNTTGTSVNLSQNNYRVIKANAIGQSSGFSLLGIIPIVPPSYTTAMQRLYAGSGIQEGHATTAINVSQERSTCCLVLFSVPRLTVRADIIEFVDKDSAPAKTTPTTP